MNTFENSDSYFIVLEYLEGGDLFDYIAKRNFNISEKRAIVKDERASFVGSLLIGV